MLGYFCGGISGGGDGLWVYAGVLTAAEGSTRAARDACAGGGGCYWIGRYANASDGTAPRFAPVAGPLRFGAGGTTSEDDMRLKPLEAAVILA